MTAGSIGGRRVERKGGMAEVCFGYLCAFYTRLSEEGADGLCTVFGGMR
jgi:hypothetical protein